ncbi:RNase adapter RapZ [Corynebacterium heidelbergense]|uniref:RNase adapter RapZ n=2 Tax=Corynebacterium heidelbergense TaxID=2055947 RepID=A0A364V975_9CORY|nr:RNase adapter RapZ [Corynebacterium heidelbergense]
MDHKAPSLVLITGMSGAGRRTTAAALEEMGWYVADNLPPELIMRMVELTFADDSPVERLAIVTDVRSRAFAGNLTGVLDSLTSSGRRPVMLFLDADDRELITRYDTVRRSHPLQGEGTLQEGIDREREMLADIRARADIIVDTTNSSVHDLRRTLETEFSELHGSGVRINLQSFGFKHGAPKDVDVLLDARFLPNPYWVAELRDFRGVDKPVADYVLGQAGSQEFVDSALHLLLAMLPGYHREGKNFVSVAVGCTGGHHRSVAVVEELARRLTAEGAPVRVVHRDLNNDRKS